MLKKQLFILFLLFLAPKAAGMESRPLGPLSPASHPSKNQRRQAAHKAEVARLQTFVDIQAAQMQGLRAIARTTQYAVMEISKYSQKILEKVRLERLQADHASQLKAKETQLREKDELILEAIGELEDKEDEANNLERLRLKYIDELNNYIGEVYRCERGQEKLVQSMDEHLLKFRKVCGAPVWGKMNPGYREGLKQHVQNLIAAGVSGQEAEFNGPLFAEVFDLMQQTAVASYFNNKPELFKASFAKILAHCHNALACARALPLIERVNDLESDLAQKKS